MMEIRDPGPHKTHGVERRFLNQASGAPFDCQAIPSLPSRKPLLTGGRFERDRPSSMLLPAFL